MSRFFEIRLRVVMLLLMTTLCFIASGEKHQFSSPSEVQVENRILAVAGADLDISPQRVSKTATWAFNFLSPMQLEQRKSNLIDALCREVGADILIDPQFTYSRRILGSGKLTVSGYPARYRDFRSLNELEIDSLILNKDTVPERVIFINR